MSRLVVRGPATVSGRVTVPGDKSISHRALMVGAVGNGQTTLRGAAPGEDVASTIRCLRTYGVGIDLADGEVAVHGKGLRSFAEPGGVLDCANSGTTMRLLAGLAAHHEFVSEFDGDASLRPRPMQRLVVPLSALGAHVETTDGHAPLRVRGGNLSGADIATDVASAQVKSAVLLAGMAADGATSVTEPAASRDHTERMLEALGASVTQTQTEDGRHRVEITPFAPPRFELDIPGDTSSAAFLVAAALLSGSVQIDNVGMNLSRIGFLIVLSQMGAQLDAEHTHEALGEPVGTFKARRSDLEGVPIDGSDPGVQDELPLLAVVATQAEGETVVRDAGELRVKESDRIAAIVLGLQAMGADIEERPDGFTVRGPTALTGAVVDAAGDHRIAMALAVAGLAAKGDTVVEGFETAAVSWPGFDRVLASLGADVEFR